MNWLKRIIRNWLGVNQDSSCPHRFVALMYWRDEIVGVDGNGDFYKIQELYDGTPVVSLWTRNPLEGGRRHDD